MTAASSTAKRCQRLTRGLCHAPELLLHGGGVSAGAELAPGDDSAVAPQRSEGGVGALDVAHILQLVLDC